MSERTPLEVACIEIGGLQSKEYYQILSNLLLLNHSFIKEIDPVLKNSTLIAHHIKKQIQDKGYITLLKNNLKPYWIHYGHRIEFKQNKN